VPGEDNVNQVNLGAPTDWVLHEQVIALQYMNVNFFLYDFPYDIVILLTSGPINTE
jgi:hypothetical protein